MHFKYGEINYQGPSNEINRLTNSIFLVPIVTTFKYFKNYENIYFLLLAIFQLLTLGILPKEWSPTGPFSTAIPLAFCLIIEIISASIKWCAIWNQNRIENNKQFQCLNNYGSLCIIKNKNLYPGHIIYLNKNDVVPIDGLLLVEKRYKRCLYLF